MPAAFRIAVFTVLTVMGMMTPEQWWHSLSDAQRAAVRGYRDKPLPKPIVASLAVAGLLPQFALNLGTGHAVYLPDSLRPLIDRSSR
jgi:hypothetical protein